MELKLRGEAEEELRRRLEALRRFVSDGTPQGHVSLEAVFEVAKSPNLQ
jgi:hypothetical protein